MKKYTLSQRIVLWVAFAIFLIYALSLLYPYLWAFLNSVKNSDDYSDNPNWLPLQGWYFKENYLEAIKGMKVGNVTFIGAFGNSVMYTFLCTLANVFCATLSSYVVAKYEFKLKNAIYSWAIFMMVIPSIGTLPASYKLITDLHLDNILGLCIVGAGGFGFNFIMFYSYFKGVSWGYAEAAFIDGASDWKVYWHIMMPQIRPAFVAMFITGAVGHWNDYMTPLLYLEDRQPVLSYIVYDMKTTLGEDNVPIFMAANLIIIVPVVIVFARFSNVIMNNTVAGGLKG